MAHILLVDDDADLVARNRAALEADGHTVTAASTTTDGLSAARRDTPDLVVLEALLDGATAGVDLARTLAHDFPALHLIMLSRMDEVLSNQELASQDRDDGWMPVDRFMEKPVAPEVLVYEVDHLLPGAH
ncbi:MAG: response regulator [Candidatus Limnocylindrales bacterium]|nr:response regulator [Candidatus Limnocylindrales bacterium]